MARLRAARGGDSNELICLYVMPLGEKVDDDLVVFDPELYVNGLFE